MSPRYQQGIAGFFAGRDDSKAQKSRRPRYTPPSDASRFGVCPMCQKGFPMYVLGRHAETCTGSRVQDEALKEPSAREDVKDSKASAVAAKRVFAVHDKDGKEDEGTEASSIKESHPVPWWKHASTRNKRRRINIPNIIRPTSEPIPGLFLYEEFITEEEETLIQAQLDGGSSDANRHDFLPWKFARFNGDHLGKRWGVHCNLRDRRVSAPEHPLPPFVHDILLEKLARLEPLAGCVPNESNAIDYRRRQGHYLQRHVDDRQLSKEPIANLSLIGDCYMTFRNEKKGTASTSSSTDHSNVRVLLRRRTLQVLTGKARYDYSHAIRNEDLLSDRRVSITMRESPLTHGKS